MTTNHDYFELRRRSDNLVYQFDRTPLADGQIGYKRRDRDLWIVYRPTLGWVALNEESGLVGGRLWDVLPADQGDHPPAGDWVSKKGAKSYVYELVYCAQPR